LFVWVRLLSFWLPVLWGCYGRVMRIVLCELLCWFCWEGQFGRFRPKLNLLLVRMSTSVNFNQSGILCCWEGQLWSKSTEGDSCAEWECQLWSISTEVESCAQWEAQLRSISTKVESSAGEKVNFGRCRSKWNLVLLKSSTSVEIDRSWILCWEGQVHSILTKVQSCAQKVNFGRNQPRWTLVLSRWSLFDFNRSWQAGDAFEDITFKPVFEIVKLYSERSRDSWLGASIRVGRIVSELLRIYISVYIVPLGKEGVNRNLIIQISHDIAGRHSVAYSAARSEQ
jgi:hypothetical protein